MVRRGSDRDLRRWVGLPGSRCGHRILVRRARAPRPSRPKIRPFAVSHVLLAAPGALLTRAQLLASCPACLPCKLTAHHSLRNRTLYEENCGGCLYPNEQLASSGRWMNEGAGVSG